MPIVFSTSGIEYGAHRIAFSDFPTLQDLHLREAPGTRVIEPLGQALAAADFPVPQLKAFIQRVCGWGGRTGNRVQGVVFARNSGDDFQHARRCFVEAWGELQQDRIDSALCCINQITGLGQPSYASKHLRFLRPDICPVMDSNIQAEVPEYTYDELGRAYQDIAAKLREARVPNRMARADGAWFVADVDMAIFVHIRYSGCDCLGRQDTQEQDFRAKEGVVAGARKSRDEESRSDAGAAKAVSTYAEAEKAAIAFARRNSYVGVRYYGACDYQSEAGAYLLSFKTTYVVVMPSGECYSKQSWTRLYAVGDSTGRTLREIFPIQCTRVGGGGGVNFRID